MKYRIDFGRLARELEEIEWDISFQEFMYKFFEEDGVADKVCNFLPEGFVLDRMVIEDEDGLNGREILDKHIKPIYNEAVLCSWDSWR